MRLVFEKLTRLQKELFVELDSREAEAEVFVRRESRFLCCEEGEIL
jgi:hypothetical protein